MLALLRDRRCRNAVYVCLNVGRVDVIDPPHVLENISGLRACRIFSR